MRKTIKQQILEFLSDNPGKWEIMPMLKKMGHRRRYVYATEVLRKLSKEGAIHEEVIPEASGGRKRYWITLADS